jgi:glycine cleavage system H protein
LLCTSLVAREPNPKAFIPCVWMDAGVVSFKLCERDLDCDSCPLDRALRGLEDRPVRSEAPEREEGEYLEVQTAPHLPVFRLQRRFFYSPWHVWLSVESRGNLRVGLDDFAQQLLGPIYLVSLPEPGTVLSLRHPLVSVTNQLAVFSLRTPVEGRVVWTNGQLAGRPSLVNRAPHTLGSLMLVEPKDLQTTLRGLRYGEQAQKWLTHESQNLAAALSEMLQEQRPRAVGETLQWLRTDPAFAAVLERFLGLQPVTRDR